MESAVRSAWVESATIAHAQTPLPTPPRSGYRATKVGYQSLSLVRQTFERSSSCSSLWNGYIERVERDRHQAIKTNEIGQLCRPVRPELFERRPVGQFGKCAVRHQRRREIICDRLLLSQIDRTLARHDGRKFLIGQSFPLGDNDMRVRPKGAGTDSGNPGTNGLLEPDGKIRGSAGLGGGGCNRAKPVSGARFPC